MRLFTSSLLILAVASLGACTTISSQTTLSQQQDLRQNLPIKNLADTLVERFTARGWAAKTDPVQQVNRLASFLTKGFGAKSDTLSPDPVDVYLTSLQAREVEQPLQQAMLDEILLASGEVRDLTQNVDLSYQDIGSGSLMRAQMLSLEQALLTTRKAHKLFTMAVRRTGGQDLKLLDGLQQLDTNIDVLTNQANGMNKARQAAATG